MTLFYLRVTPESIRREYYSALDRLSKQGQISLSNNVGVTFTVQELFKDLILLLNKSSHHSRLPLLIRRLKRIQIEINTLI